MVCLITGEKFAELLGKDPALLAKLGLEIVKADAAAASVSAAAFITNAVKEAKALGLEFNEDEGWRKALVQRGQALVEVRSRAGSAPFR